jgi:small-conductance mechanosensitive channel
MSEPLSVLRQGQWLLTHEQWSDIGKAVAAKAGVLAALVVIGLIVQFLLHRLIDKLVGRAEHGVLPDRISHAAFSRGMGEPPPGSTRRVQRAKALGSLLKSISSAIIAAIVVTMMLSAVGLDIGPILASAGIVGVALGFGSQTLVKDFLSGIFLIFEDQYGVGDAVDLGEGLTGTVEAVSLRVTRVRDTNGTVWYARNGELLRVGNMSQNWARTVLDIQVSAREDLARVRGVLQDVIDDIWHDEDFDGVIIEEPEIWGIEAITPDAITLRVTLKTAPMQQWRIARVLRERIKSRFDHEGIQAPYPTSVIMNRTPGATTDAPATDAPATVGADSGDS